MAATKLATELEAAEQAILDAVAVQGHEATTTNVIRAASTENPPAVVREAYWLLISENRIVRTANGHLARA
jgi:hypothetical protein